ncbi:MAG: hypothetical protein A2096_10965 [Spirochaetes bacterium GWF1_41_5]|nr:MAG: hypothetical protein A2096_10965 [Spirochaetes bacterium GWF1_41_5]
MYIPISNDFVRFVSDKTDKIRLLGIPSRTCPKLAKGKIIALRYRAVLYYKKMINLYPYIFVFSSHLKYSWAYALIIFTNANFRELK